MTVVLPLTTPAQTRFATPHLVADIVGIAVFDALFASDARQLDLPGVGDTQLSTIPCVPAEGEEFVAVHLSASGSVFSPGPSSVPSIVLQAGKTRVSLDLGTYNSTLHSYANQQHVAVLSVPIGTPVTLVVNDVDLAADYDVRAGKLATDAETKRLIAAARTSAISIKPDKARWAGGWTDGTNVDVMKVEFDFNADSSYLASWMPNRGWAPKGRKWLVVFYRPSYEAKLYTPMTVDLGKAAVTSGGKKYLAKNGKKVKTASWLVAFNDSSLTFVVPDSFTKGTFTVTFPSTLRVTYRDGQKRTWPNRGAGRPLSATITAK